MKNIALLLSYVGTSYHGWQRQENAVTVQATLEDALASLTGKAVTLHGCGRTDAGVHALRYVANFKTDCSVPAERFPAALRPLLPNDIAVSAACEVGEDLHARFSCAKKEYIYKLYAGPSPDPFLYRRAHYTPYPLDVELMDSAAACFAGTRDFRAFAAAGGSVRSTVRTVYECHAEGDEKSATIRITADGFLYNMARIIAGTLLAVSRGKMDGGDIPGLFENGARENAGVTAPPWGLYLNRIWYKDGHDLTFSGGDGA